MPRASPPPENPAAFVSRRDRPEHQQRRAGTGRQITNRDFGILGRHTGVRLQQTTKDLDGFDDLDKAWNSDNDADQENAGTLQNRSSLFPESPQSASTAPNELEPEIAAKKLEFNENQVEDQTPDLSDSEPGDEVPSESEDEAPQPVKSKPAASRSKQNGQKSSEIVKKAAKKGKAKPSPVEVVSQQSKSNTVKEKTKAKKVKAVEKSRSSPLQNRLTPSNQSDENDENEAPDSDAVDEDSGSDTEQESVQDSPIVEPLKQSKNSQRKQTGTKKSLPAKKKRRQTLVIIDEAQQSGLIDQHTMVVENDQLVRRSQRARVRPVAFFQCEQPNYIRGPGGLFTLDREKTIVRHVPTPPPPPSRRIRQKRRRPKSSQESSDEEEEELLPLLGETKVIGPNSKERRQIVAVRASDHAMMRISTKPPAGVKAQSKDLVPTICKFDGLDRVTAGIIRIPASGQKYLETSSRTEVFFVASCERNSLLVKINNTEFKLSKGDTFMVPDKNPYSIANLSDRKPAELFFSAARD